MNKVQVPHQRRILAQKSGKTPHHITFYENLLQALKKRTFAPSLELTRPALSSII
jgi:hypothetical protein